MMKFSTFFWLDSKRILRLRNLVIFFLMFCLFIYTVNKGIDEHRDMVKKSKEFQVYERSMFSKMLNYTHYSFFGVRYFFVPARSAVFFTDNTLSPELMAKIDSISNVNIYANCRGGSLFKNIKSRINRFSGLFYLLGTLLSLIAGLDAMRYKEFNRSTFGTVKGLKGFGYIILSRFLFILSAVIILFMAAFINLFVRGMVFSASDISGLSSYLASLLLTFLFMLIIGSLIGKLRSREAGIFLAFAIWFGLIILVPEFLASFLSEKAEKITSSYHVDLKKLAILKDFEDSVLKKEGKYTKEKFEAYKKLAEEYWKNDYPKIWAEEEHLRLEVESLVRLHNILSTLCPTTFLNMTEANASSRSYENSLLFHQYALSSQNDFSRFFIDRVYYHDPKQLVSFIKGNENLFHAKSRIPTYFLSGVIILSFIILVLFSWGALSFKKWLYPSTADLKSRKTFSNAEKNLRLESDKNNVIYTRLKTIAGHLFLIFTLSGPYDPFKKHPATKKKKREAKTPVNSTESPEIPGSPGSSESTEVEDNLLNVLIDKQPVSSFLYPNPRQDPAKKREFVYICPPDKLPGDIYPENFISFSCRTWGASLEEEKSIIAEVSDTLSPVNKDTDDKKLKKEKKKRLQQLEPQEQAVVLLSTLHLVKGDIILVDSIGRDMPVEVLVKLVDQLELLAKNGAAVIYLTPDGDVKDTSSCRNNEVYVLPTWAGHVKAHRFLIKKKV